MKQYERYINEVKIIDVTSAYPYVYIIEVICIDQIKELVTDLINERMGFRNKDETIEGYY